VETRAGATVVHYVEHGMGRTPAPDELQRAEDVLDTLLDFLPADEGWRASSARPVSKELFANSPLRS